jgi:hypothetical protein
MKHLLILLALIVVAVVPACASMDFGFSNAIDTAGWETNWNDGGNHGTISLAIVGGALQITVVTPDTTGDAINVQRTGSNITSVSTDSIWSINLRASSIPPGGWFYTQIFSQNGGWDWHANGSNIDVVNKTFVDARGSNSGYMKIGFQIGFNAVAIPAGTYVFIADNGRLGSTSIPVELIDFDASVTK